MNDHSVRDSASHASTLPSSVLLRAKNGEPAAFERLVDLFAGLVYAWCRRSGLAPEDAEDVGQQVFMTVSRGLKSFQRDANHGSFRGWLLLITRSRILDFRRSQQRSIVTVQADSKLFETAENGLAPEIESDAEAERAILIAKALELVAGEFSSVTRDAFQRLMLEGQSAKEVAAALGVTPNAVYIAKSRIMKRLHEEFGDVFDPPS